MANSSLMRPNPVAYTVQNNLDVVKLYFNIAGSSMIHYHGIAGQFDVRAGYYNMLYSPALSTTLLHQGDCSEIFSLQMTKKQFLTGVLEKPGHVTHFADDVAAGRPSILSPCWLPIDYRIANCIRDILHCPFIRNLRDLYLKAKAMELFALTLNAIPNQPGLSVVKTSAEQEKLTSIKEYILEHYASDISLAILSRKFELNEFKLKRGFREIFGQSVIDYVIDQRLQQAKKLLLTKMYTVTEVSYKVGYSSPQYFSRAFRKKVGISPSETR